jgi:hypothetical protein
MKLVVIEWEDIQSETGWCEDTDPDCPVFRTVGFLVKKTDRKVIIADTEPDQGTITVFPRGCILRIEEIKYGKGKEVQQEQSGALQKLPVRKQSRSKTRKVVKEAAKQRTVKGCGKEHPLP